MSEAEGQQHPISIYLWIWGLLFVLSGFSYMVDYLQLQGYLRWSLILLLLFYILCEVREDGFHFVGYFSKEKVQEENQNTRNLSCIMVMPFCQRSGYGKLLIEMSYALSILEGKPGSPERPLSDLGHRTYVSFWTRRVVQVLLDLGDDVNQVTIKKIKEETGMIEKDIQYILKYQQI